jgi:hypothetical protein
MKAKKITFLPIILLIAVSVCFGGGAAHSKPMVEATSEDKINVNVENGTLNEMLRIMSEKQLLEIKGALPGSENITVNFSNLSLEEALKKIMRGYNYVLIKQGEDRRPLLLILGKADRSKYADQPGAVAQPAGPQPGQTTAGQPPDSRSYVPPSQLPPPPPPASAASRPRPSPSDAKIPGASTTPPGQVDVPVSPGTTGVEQKDSQQQATEKTPSQGGQGLEQQPAQPGQPGVEPIQPGQPQPTRGRFRTSGVSARDAVGGSLSLNN